jgi:hypothetical protein
MNEQMLCRVLHPEVRVLDEEKGLVEYVASDETLDSYKEVIRASGWRFTHFSKNAPFVDSHEYNSIASLLGRVVDFKVAGGRLVETVQWAKDVPENALAQLGWRMTQAGFLRAVSVGFYPTRTLTQFSSGEQKAQYDAEVKDLGLEGSPPRAIYCEQEQIELSSCIIGANPNALARAYKAGALNDADLEFISGRAAEMQQRRVQHAGPAQGTDAAGQALHRGRLAMLVRLHEVAKGI